MASGETHEYVSSLLRRSFRRPDGRVGKQTLASRSADPDAAIDAVEAVLKGKTDADAAPAADRRCRMGMSPWSPRRPPG